MCPALVKQIRSTALLQRAYILPWVEELHAGLCESFLDMGHQRGKKLLQKYAGSYVTDEPQVCLASLSVTA